MKIRIDDVEHEIQNTYQGGYLPSVETEGGEFYIATDTEKAGEASEERWRDMAENDPDEFICMVGKGNLVKWALGQSAGPGSVHVNSLEGWFNLVSNYPEEDWAGYDGVELDIQIDEELADELGFDVEAIDGWVYCVAYRN